MVERQCWDVLDQGVDDSGAKLDASTGNALSHKGYPHNLAKLLDIVFAL